MKIWKVSVIMNNICKYGVENKKWNNESKEMKMKIWKEVMIINENVSKIMTTM